MFNLSSNAGDYINYATVQQAGKMFASVYYGRLNAFAKSLPVNELFTERTRYYALDTLDGRPAVGRADAARAVNRFREMYGGERRFVLTASVDAQVDEDDYNDENDNDATVNGRVDRYNVFVQAEWTEKPLPGRKPAVVPFVQTFRVRHLSGSRFEIISTVVKTVSKPQLRQLDDYDDDDDYDRFKDSTYPVENENNCYETTQQEKFADDEILSKEKNQLNIEAVEFNIMGNDEEEPPSTPTGTAPVAYEPYEKDVQVYDGYRTNHISNEMWPTKEYLDYQKKVNDFLKGTNESKKKPTSTKKQTNHGRRSMNQRRSGKFQKSHEYPADVPHDFPTNTVCVDRLVASTTANQLQSAFTRYGNIKSVRMFSSDPSGRYLPGRPIQHSANICFENFDSVEKIMSDSRSPGIKLNGNKLEFRKWKPSRL